VTICNQLRPALLKLGVRAALTLLTFFLVGNYCFAQNPPVDHPALTVVKNKWHGQLRDPDLDRDPNQATSDRQAADARRRQVEQMNDISRAQGMPVRDLPEPQTTPDLNNTERSMEYVYEVTVRNDGSKAVSSVTWEYVFLDPRSGGEVGRRRFTTKSSVPVGKTRTLSARSAIPPTGTIDVSKMKSNTPEHYNEKIVVLSIEYSDGSKWNSSETSR
jgi:hypothetical protein